MIFRRGNVFIVHNEARGTAFRFDGDTGEVTGDKTLAELTTPNPLEWLPVLETEPLPIALTVRLLLRFPA